MSIAFLQKTLYYEVTLKFAIGKGQFVNLKDQRSTEQKLLDFHLKKHRSLQEHSASTETLLNILKAVLFHNFSSL